MKNILDFLSNSMQVYGIINAYHLNGALTGARSGAAARKRLLNHDAGLYNSKEAPKDTSWQDVFRKIKAKFGFPVYYIGNFVPE